MDVWGRIRYARDRALEAEEVERQGLAEAKTAEVDTAPSADDAERSYAGAGTPSADVREQPGSQVAS